MFFLDQELTVRILIRPPQVQPCRILSQVHVRAYVQISMISYVAIPARSFRVFVSRVSA